MRKWWLLTIAMAFAVVTSAARKYKLVEIETNLGTLKVKLYQDTPLHSENFLKLAAAHHYDSLLFHRVIREFMIQGGDSASKGAPQGKLLGASDPGYTIEAEIRPEHLHLKGALAAARQGDEVNPEKRSSAEQFYIVQGKTYTDKELDQIENRKWVMAKNRLGEQLYKPLRERHINYLRTGRRTEADSLIRSIERQIEERYPDAAAFTFSPETRELYKSIGGTPFLDGDYTVFGEVVEGLDIIDKIAAVETDKNDRPKEDVMILSMKLKRK